MPYATKNVNGEEVDLTPEEISELEARDAAVEAALPATQYLAVRTARRLAYQAESDPMLARTQRLVWLGDAGADQARTDYLAKVEEIKARFPYPAGYNPTQ